MMEKVSITEVLEFYHDNVLEEIISERSQNYFAQKEVVKTKVIEKPVIQNKVVVTQEKQVTHEFVNPIFSTSDALSSLAKKAQDNTGAKKVVNSQTSQAFISLNEIVAKAKKLADESKNLAELRAAIENFDGCNLKKMATNTVFCDGNPNSKVMIIGEAPGNDEDLKGIPFCGDSGDLLDGMFRAINMTREDLYLTNVIFWRPPGNRRPTEEELAICKPFIERHIQLINPDILVLVGATSMATLTGITEPISNIRGKFIDFSPEFLSRSIKTFAIFHPSYLMRQPTKKRLAWLDMINLEKFLKSL
jgi:uracil-DNA glycosylase